MKNSKLIVGCGLLAMAAASAAPPAFAQSRVETAEPDIRVQMDAMATGALVVFLMRDVMGVPYVIAPEVLTDRRPVSISLVMPPREVPDRVVQFLRGIGLSVELRGGTVYVARGGASGGFARSGGSTALLPGQVPPDEVSQGGIDQGESRPGQRSAGAAPPKPGAAFGEMPTAPDGFGPIDPEREVAIVRLGNRSHGELADLVRSIFPQLLVSERSDFSVSNNSIVPPSTSDFIVMTGEDRELSLAERLLAQLDEPQANVSVKALVVEVAERSERGSTLSIVAELFGQALGVRSFDGLGGAAGQSVSLSVGGLSAMLGVIKEDGRFAIVAEPQLILRDGTTARLVAGAEVPTLGAVTIAEEGQVIRSVEYRQSGLTLDVAVERVGDAVRVDVRQERSSFGRTNTGVDDSPTLNTATAQASLTIRPGEVVALAGIEQNQTDETKSGILPGLFGSRRRSESRSQLLVLLEANALPIGAERAPTRIQRLRYEPPPPPFLGEESPDVPRSHEHTPPVDSELSPEGPEQSGGQPEAVDHSRATGILGAL